MSSVITFHTADDGNVRTITFPIRILANVHAQFFACIATPTHTHAAERVTRVRRSQHAYREQIVTVLENLASAEDLPATPHEWLPTLITRVQRTIRDTSAHAVPLSACLGITYHEQHRRTISFAATGAMIVQVVARSDRGALRIGTLSPAQEIAVPLAFAHIADGRLGPYDALLVGPAAFHAILDHTLLRRAFAAQAPGERIAVLRRALRDVPDAPAGIMVCGLTIASGQRSHASMESFLHTAMSTESFLTPRLAPLFQRYAEHVRHLGRLVARTRLRRRPTPHATVREEGRARILTIITAAIRLAFQTFAVILHSVGAMCIDALRLFSVAALRGWKLLHNMLGHAVTAWAARRAQPHDTSTITAHHVVEHGISTPRTHDATRIVLLHQRARQFILHANTITRTWYAALPKQSQRLLLIAGVFALLFMTSTTLLWRKQIVESDVAAYNATIARIEELRSIGEARLLFGERDEARSAFTDAVRLVAELPRTSHVRRDRAALLSRELTASLDRARVLTRIGQPLIVTKRDAQTGTLDGKPFGHFATLVMLGESLAVMSDDSTRLALIHPHTGTVVTRSLIPQPQLSAPVFSAAFDDRSILLMDEQAHAVLIDSVTGIVTPLTIEEPPQQIRSAAVFRKRLYLLHADGGVTRHNRTAGGFARGSLWLNGVLPDAARIAVNGSLLLSSSAGALEQYIAGRKQNRDLQSAVDPPLENAVFMTSLPDSDMISLGIPHDGRIVVLHDDGTLVAQVQSDSFRMMRALALDPTGTSHYILAGDAVFVVVVPTS